MNIGKASKLSELTVKAVRYYDNIGLVKPHQNIFSGYREYNNEDVLKLKFVGKARNLILVLMNVGNYYLYTKIKAGLVKM